MNFQANELWGNRQPICPYCKQKQSMDDYYPDEGVHDLECENCEKKFVVQVRIERQFDTVGDCALNGEMPHELKLLFDFKNTKEYRCLKCRAEIYGWALEGGTYQKLTADQYVIVGDEVKK